MKSLFAITLVALLGSTALVSAQQALCGEYEAIATHLKNKYGEKPTHKGATLTGYVLEQWESETTWSMVLVSPENEACLVSAGNSWEKVSEGEGV
jgi:hypothetical protein